MINVFFTNNIFSGLIDFYFACNDYYTYELAICINAWCFNSKFELDYDKSAAFLNTYQNFRKLSKKEKESLAILLRGAAIRFLLTRLYDAINYQGGTYVNMKDPMEYFNILQFHQQNNFLKKVVF